MTPCWNSQRGLSDLTFDVLIWSSGENRLPARSRLWSSQFADVAALDCCACPRGAGAAEASTAETATMLNSVEPFGSIEFAPLCFVPGGRNHTTTSVKRPPKMRRVTKRFYHGDTETRR